MVNVSHIVRNSHNMLPISMNDLEKSDYVENDHEAFAMPVSE
jgi:hypothetical protein